ncbi:MAG: S8 family peptidase, partial [Xenococcus sp. (in: cyanobacteria)]
RKRNPITEANFGNRQGHGGKLRNSANSIISEWKEERKKREEDEEILFDAQRLILQIDPDAFDPDALKSYGIEVIAELENGFIIGASADIDLTNLQKKIEKFINEEYGGNKVAEIWDLIEGKKRPELIVSEELWEHWDQIKDNQIYTVDVGIACLGIQTKLSNYPKRKEDESDDKWTKRMNKWINKREITEQEWQYKKDERESYFIDFVNRHKGEILSIIDSIIPSAANLSDSFTCRIRICGKGLKDLVFNFPYVFEISEPDEFQEWTEGQGIIAQNESSFNLQSPDVNAPKVCVIDSGIQDRHSLLKVAIDQHNSRSFVPNKANVTADYVSSGGHGTKVAGAILYPREIPKTGTQKAICWLQNARVLDDDCYLPTQLFPPDLLSEIIAIYHKSSNTKIFNHSITGSVPCRTQYMSAWASAIDELTWHNNILLIVAAGNLSMRGRVGTVRLSVQSHLHNSKEYPDYLLEKSCRIANPAQSFQALTVGSIAHTFYKTPDLESIAQPDHPSAFSRSGFGIWDSIKPEVVEYGGDYVIDNAQPPNVNYTKEVCPELVRSTLHGGFPIGKDTVGTSFSTPKVTHIAACLADQFPEKSCLLYRALIVQSARWPQWTDNLNNEEKVNVLRCIGYGIPNLDRALGNSPHRITLMTQQERKIKAKEAHVYQVKLPQTLRSQGDEIEFLIEVTLSYKAQPRRTRRNRRRYLSTWLDWDCSKKGEDPDRFLARIIKDYESPEDAEKGEGIFKWTLGKQKTWGKLKGVSRTSGTIQKDWTIAKSFDLRESFCLAVVGHEGWNNDPDANVPYSLVVSFEAVNSEIPIYLEVAKAQIEIDNKIETEVRTSV